MSEIYTFCQSTINPNALFSCVVAAKWRKSDSHTHIFPGGNATTYHSETILYNHITRMKSCKTWINMIHFKLSNSLTRNFSTLYTFWRNNIESGISQLYLDRLSFFPLFGAMCYENVLFKQFLLSWRNTHLFRN